MGKTKEQAAIAPTVTSAPPAPANETQEVAFARFEAQARALAPEAVKIRGDTQLGLDNSLRGVSAVLARRSDLEKVWSPARIDALIEVPSLAKAAVYAAALADLADLPSGIQKRIVEAYRQRDMFVSALDTATKFGILQADEVAKFHEGRGPLASAQCLVDLVGFWRRNAAVLAGKTPATPQHLDEAEQLGNQLVVDIRRKGTPKDKDPVAAAAADLANRYWTLLVNGYFEVLKAGFELWGREYEKEVPALLARTVTKRKGKDDETDEDTDAEGKGDGKKRPEAPPPLPGQGGSTEGQS